jgi:hypothetical protein
MGGASDVPTTYQQESGGGSSGVGGEVDLGGLSLEEHSNKVSFFLSVGMCVVWCLI